jgi:dipeptidyl aminopeptidase/acylaminoacyl peptidase
MEKKVFFNHPSGVKLCGILDNPSNNPQNPIVIIVHGFTSSKDSKSYPPLIKRLKEAGISTFRIDLFAHGESEGNFADITISKGKESILAAINYLKEENYQNIALLGSSFGGISALMAASETKSLFCLALKSPVSDLLQVKFQREENILERWKKDGVIDYIDKSGSKKLNYDFIEDEKQNRPFAIAGKIKIPTLIVHGDKDEIVTYQNSVKLNKLLPNSQLHTVKNANHGYSSDPEHFAEMTKVISDFLIKESKKTNL